MSESQITPEQSEKRIWQWEVVVDPEERLRLIGATIAEVILQKATIAAGYAELAGSNHPEFAKDRTNYVQQAQAFMTSVGQQLQAIQRVIRLDPTEPLPINRTTYENNQTAIIVLDQVPNLPE